MIRALPFVYDVTEALQQIQSNPSVWNRHRDRIDRYGSPHTCVDDIWVRFNDIALLDVDRHAFFQGPHESVWYPVADELPAVKSLVDRLLADVGGGRLGGVLITRIHPGGRVEPHTDTGWHAGFYEKFAIQLQGNGAQAFHFEDSQLSAMPGESYTFDNSKLHWVTNDSDTDRMTLIVCIRRNLPMLRPAEHVPFDMYFASLVAMQVHPGAGTKEHKQLSLEQCRNVALDMVAIRRTLTGEES